MSIPPLSILDDFKKLVEMDEMQNSALPIILAAALMAKYQHAGQDTPDWVAMFAYADDNVSKTADVLPYAKACDDWESLVKTGS